EVPVANIAFVGSENLLSLLLEAGKANDKDYTRNLINSQVVPSYHDTHLPAVRQYHELMDRYKPMPPPDLVEKSYRPRHICYVNLEGFLNAKLLVGILTKMGKDIGRDRIKKVVESIDQFDLGIDVLVSFGPKKHQGLDKVYFTTVAERRFVRLD